MLCYVMLCNLCHELVSIGLARACKVPQPNLRRLASNVPYRRIVYFANAVIVGECCYITPRLTQHVSYGDLATISPTMISKEPWTFKTYSLNIQFEHIVGNIFSTIQVVFWNVSWWNCSQIPICCELCRVALCRAGLRRAVLRHIAARWSVIPLLVMVVSSCHVSGWTTCLTLLV